ncbi:GRIP and Coiled-Coil Domain Containing 88 [Paratrimastix pyriformis]|uniref:GRIP and Coiled-Coil Domain Containing 88 n=1 Tax=Paratrimastix pyriformis TaxID=342808 RepID=A0ABQ8UUD3_9EUKA|nr:GRIP and Coiled-Coil Domain Containing 88 [Paratrimastix pyriformis]
MITKEQTKFQKMVLLYKKTSADRDLLDQHLRRLLPPTAIPAPPPNPAESPSQSPAQLLLSVPNLGEVVEAQAQLLVAAAQGVPVPPAGGQPTGDIEQLQKKIAELEQHLLEKGEVAAMLERKLAKLKASGAGSTTSPPHRTSGAPEEIAEQIRALELKIRQQETTIQQQQQHFLIVSEKKQRDLAEAEVALKRAQDDNVAYQQTTDALSAKFTQLQTDRADLQAKVSALQRQLQEAGSQSEGVIQRLTRQLEDAQAKLRKADTSAAVTPGHMAQLQELRAQHEVDAIRWSSEQKILEKALHDKEAELAALQAQHAALAAEHATCHLSLESANEGSAQRIQQIQEQLVTSQASLEAANRTSQQLQELEEQLDVTHAALESANIASHERVQKLEEELASARAALETANSDTQKLAQKLAEQLEETRVATDALAGEAQAQGRTRQLEEELAAATTATEDANRRAQDLEARLLQARQETADLRSTISAIQDATRAQANETAQTHETRLREITDQLARAQTAQERLEQCERALEELRAQMKRDRETFEEQLAAAQRALQESHQVASARIQEEEHAIAEGVAKLGETQSDLVRCRQEAAQANAKMAAQSAHIQTLHQAFTQSTQALDLWLEHAQSRESEHAARIQALEAQRNESARCLSERDHEVATLSALLHDATTALDQLRIHSSTTDQELATIRAEMTSAREAATKSDEQRVLSDKQQQQVTTELEEARQQLDAARKELGQCGTAHAATQQELDAATGDLRNLHAQLDETNHALDAARCDLEGTRSRLAASDDALQQRAAELAAAQTRLTASRDELATSQEQLRALGADLATSQKQHATTQHALELARQESAAVKEELSQLSAQHTALSQTAAESTRELNVTTAALQSAKQEALAQSEQLAEMKQAHDRARIQAESLADQVHRLESLQQASEEMAVAALRQQVGEAEERIAALREQLRAVQAEAEKAKDQATRQRAELEVQVQALTVAKDRAEAAAAKCAATLEQEVQACTARLQDAAQSAAVLERSLSHAQTALSAAARQDEARRAEIAAIRALVVELDEAKNRAVAQACECRHRIARERVAARSLETQAQDAAREIGALSASLAEARQALGRAQEDLAGARQVAEGARVRWEQQAAEQTDEAARLRARIGQLEGDLERLTTQQKARETEGDTRHAAEMAALKAELLLAQESLTQARAQLETAQPQALMARQLQTALADLLHLDGAAGMPQAAINGVTALQHDLEEALRQGAEFETQCERLAAERDALRGQLEASEEGSRRAAAQVDETSRQLQAAREDAAKVQAQLDAEGVDIQRRSDEALAAARREVSDANARHAAEGATLHDKLTAALQERDQARARTEQAQTETKRAEESLIQADQKAARLQGEAEQAQSERADLAKTLAAAQAELEAIRASVSRTQESDQLELGQARSRVAALEHELLALRTLCEGLQADVEARATRCMALEGDLARAKDERAAQAGSLQAELRTATELVTDRAAQLERMLATTQELQAANAKLEEALVHLRAELQASQTQLAQEKTNAAALETRATKLAADLEGAHTQCRQEAEKAQSALEDVRTARQEVSQLHEAVRLSRNRADRAEANAQKLQAQGAQQGTELEQTRDQASHLQEAIEQAQSQLSELRAQLETLQAQAAREKSEAEQAQARLGVDLTSLRTELAQTQAQLVQAQAQLAQEETSRRGAEAQHQCDEERSCRLEADLSAAKEQGARQAEALGTATKRAGLLEESLAATRMETQQLQADLALTRDQLAQKTATAMASEAAACQKEEVAAQLAELRARLLALVVGPSEAAPAPGLDDAALVERLTALKDQQQRESQEAQDRQNKLKALLTKANVRLAEENGRLVPAPRGLSRFASCPFLHQPLLPSQEHLRASQERLEAFELQTSSQHTIAEAWLRAGILAASALPDDVPAPPPGGPDVEVSVGQACQVLARVEVPRGPQGEEPDMPPPKECLHDAGQVWYYVRLPADHGRRLWITQDHLEGLLAEYMQPQAAPEGEAPRVGRLVGSLELPALLSAVALDESLRRIGTAQQEAALAQHTLATRTGELQRELERTQRDFQAYRERARVALEKNQQAALVAPVPVMAGVGGLVAPADASLPRGSPPQSPQTGEEPGEEFEELRHRYQQLLSQHEALRSDLARLSEALADQRNISRQQAEERRRAEEQVAHAQEALTAERLKMQEELHLQTARQEVAIQERDRIISGLQQRLKQVEGHLQGARLLDLQRALGPPQQQPPLPPASESAAAASASTGASAAAVVAASGSAPGSPSMAPVPAGATTWATPPPAASLLLPASARSRDSGESAGLEGIPLSPAEGQSRQLARLCAAKEEELLRCRAEAAQARGMLQDADKHRETALKQVAMLKEQISELQRGQTRENVDLTYLKNVLLKLLESQQWEEQLILVLGQLLHFSPAELDRLRAIRHRKKGGLFGMFSNPALWFALAACRVAACSSLDLGALADRSQVGHTRLLISSFGRLWSPVGCDSQPIPSVARSLTGTRGGTSAS